MTGMDAMHRAEKGGRWSDQSRRKASWEAAVGTGAMRMGVRTRQPAMHQLRGGGECFKKEGRSS